MKEDLDFSKNRARTQHTADGAQTPRSLSQQRYARFAQAYVTSKTHAQGQDLDRLVELAQAQPHWVALDVATGGGHTALRFAPWVGWVIATDLTANMLAAAQTHIRSQGAANVTFAVADAQDLPFQSAAFDLVTCRVAPHHFVDVARFVCEGARVLKPGGLLLVQDHVLPEDQATGRYVDDFQRLRDPSHNRAYAASEWIALFQQAGLQVEHTEQIIKEHDFVEWTLRQECSAQVVERLLAMMDQATETKPPFPAVMGWMQPRDFGTPNATFIDHHILIAGRAHRG